VTLADETRWMDATEQAALVRAGDVHPTELVTAAVERIEQMNPTLNAVVSQWFDEALGWAADPDLPGGPLRGVPFLLKDLSTAMAGQPLSNGNRALKDAGWRPPADSTLVARYRAAGLVILGRTNTPEFGTLPVTEPEAWGPTRNPWDLSRTPGGSSGGSAAAVAAGMVPVAHASDGGGSIRIPASCCGLVGLKVSQGRTSMGPGRDESGLSVEHVVARSVRDTALLLDVSHGPGVGDTVIASPPARPYAAEIGADPGRLRIGVQSTHPLGLTLDPACAEAARTAGKLLASLGHDVDEAWPAMQADPSLPVHFTRLWATQRALAVARVEEIVGRPTTDDEVEALNRVMAEHARQSSALDLALAQAAASNFRRALHAWWAPPPAGDGWDLLVTPTVAELPPRIGEHANDPSDPMAPMRRAGRWVPFTPAFNLSGQPAISLPLHESPEGLPVGVQLVAAYGGEDALLRVAAQLEAASPWAHRQPSL
jgi:amidase